MSEIGRTPWFGVKLRGGAYAGDWRWAFQCHDRFSAVLLTANYLPRAELTAISGPHSDIDEALRA